MEYINSCDYDYIINKYHDSTKPFDSHKRFIRNDALFSPDSGMDPALILAGLTELAANEAALPHPIIKANGFAYVLTNTRIRCDRRDLFPAICMIDRPLNKVLVNPWKQEVFTRRLPRLQQKLTRYRELGIATLLPDYDHSVPVWDRVFRLGFPGLLAESRSARREKQTLTPDQEAFFTGVDITYSAILDFLGRLERRATEDGSEEMARALARLQAGPPQSFYEALLTDYLYFMLNEHIEGLQVRSLSNFDRLLYPFYQKDLDRGVPEQTLRRQLAYFLLQFTAIGNYWNQPVYLGGCKEDGATQINALSYVFLDVYDKMGIYNPKVQLKIAQSTPKDFVCKALDMIRRGNNSLVFVGDATIRKALERAGATAQEARLCDVKGCYEYAVQGTLGTEMNYVNLMKPMEFALHQGRDGLSGELMGLPCPPAEAYESFDSFLAEYQRQLAHLIGQVMEAVNAFEAYLAYINPQSMLSATCRTCLERGRDTLDGGATKNVTGMMFGYLANAADSLTNIKTFVFEEKALTLGQLRDMLDADFRGAEQLQLQLLAHRDKYGNNKDLPDRLARQLQQFVCSLVQGKPNAANRGGQWNVGFHVARQSYSQGLVTAASADGRRRGEELSKNLSASMGRNREGATAAILSVTKLDATEFVGDAPLDLGLLPSAVQGQEGLEAMYGLLMAFLQRGGHAMHINVFDAETLRRAQAHPEKYRDLQIRVCGWNVLWNNICREEQDGFIRQAEALV